MRRLHILPSLLGLAATLSLTTLLPLTGTHADAPPVGLLASPVSTSQETHAPLYTGCGGVPGVPSSNTAYEQEVVERVNAIRAANSLPPFKRVSPLDEAARYFATDMAQDNYWPASPLESHATYDRDGGGNLVYACNWSSRVQSYYGSYLRLAENIAAGYSSPESVVNGWMNSSGHRANILSANSWEIGVGYYQGGSWGRYWVQDFGRRGGIYPVVINQEAAETGSRDVSLYIYGAGTWTEMRLRNDNGTWTAWQPFQAAPNWTLASAGGERTVWVEMRNASQTATSSDTIYLIAPALGNLPDTLQFIYDISEQRLLPQSHQVTPSNVGNSDAVDWTLTTEGTWLTAAPLSGSTPSSFWITATTFATGTAATYTGAVTVTTTPAIDGSPHRIDLSLYVIGALPFDVYLPLVMDGHSDTRK